MTHNQLIEQIAVPLNELAIIVNTYAKNKSIKFLAYVEQEGYYTTETGYCNGKSGTKLKPSELYEQFLNQSK